jgi:hypothetical protein
MLLWYIGQQSVSTVLTEGWNTRQVDYTNAFAQAKIHEEIYVKYLKFFESKTREDCVLKSKKSLHDLRQAPWTFFEKIKRGLLERKWVQSQIDPCLFMKPGMICAVYVDDTIIVARQLSDINQELMSLGIVDDNMKHAFTLRDEGEVNAFLGIQIKRLTSDKFQLTQPGLIDKILRTMNLENCNGCDTLATTNPIDVDQDGPAFNESWQYDSVIDMMMYLANKTRPDIAYAIDQAERFTHHPRQSHAVGVKKIAQYSKQTKL